MSWTIEDLGDPARQLEASAWTWRPLLALIESFRILDAEKLELLGYNVGAEVTAEQAREIARRLETDVLPHLREGERIMGDGSTSDVPDDGKLHREETWRNYSVDRAFLVSFVDFCKCCDGFSAG